MKIHYKINKHIPYVHKPYTVIEDIRLRDGYSQFSGRVEVYVGGEWGTVCSDRWDIEDAHVACRWLGFDGADSAKTMAFFGEGSGPIWIDNARCVGDEETLNECKKRPLGDHNCRHSKDAGVECSMGEPTIHGVRAGVLRFFCSPSVKPETFYGFIYSCQEYLQFRPRPTHHPGVLHVVLSFAFIQPFQTYIYISPVSILDFETTSVSKFGLYQYI